MKNRRSTTTVANSDSECHGDRAVRQGRHAKARESRRDLLAQDELIASRRRCGGRLDAARARHRVIASAQTADQLCTRAHAEHQQQRGHMVLDGAFAEVRALRNLAVRFAGKD